MKHFELRGGAMHAEDVPLSEIADAVGTPVYVYSSAAMIGQAETFRAGLARLGDPLIAFAVKANPNGAVLKTLAEAGLGADVVSGGELRRALAAGIPASKIVFSGVGKTRDEMELACRGGIYQFNLESESEAEMLSEVAVGLGCLAPIAFRINPDVDAGTHAKISTGRAENKFGIPEVRALAAYARAASLPGLKVQGVAVHIGSQLTSLAPLEQAFTKVGGVIAALREAGHEIQVADLGGGLGVPYEPAKPLPPTPQAYGEMIARVTKDWNVRLVFEPGRVIVGNAGILLTRVIRVKEGGAGGDPFVIVDAGMNDLMRPSLYDAWHDIRAVAPRGARVTANVVGPVCETGDTFATGREVDRVEEGDLVAFMTSGAYAATMASTYNSRPLTAEVMVRGNRFAVIRDRQDIEALIRADRMPPWLASD
ncbi:MAG TPA: diaminopimelate decarboxylase [Allosphingosinicella sp.]|uniref:diaminopimelate decarboxylase n=1 Tax=Allosphingosinicella sp. TaxID=2823234 RepID=UPI002ED9DF8E